MADYRFASMSPEGMRTWVARMPHLRELFKIFVGLDKGLAVAGLRTTHFLVGATFAEVLPVMYRAEWKDYPWDNESHWPPSPNFHFDGREGVGAQIPKDADTVTSVRLFQSLYPIQVVSTWGLRVTASSHRSLMMGRPAIPNTTWVQRVLGFVPPETKKNAALGRCSLCGEYDEGFAQYLIERDGSPSEGILDCEKEGSI